jgi:hypothetical protein
MFKKSKILGRLILLSGFLASSLAMAGGVGTGRITTLLTMPNNTNLIFFATEVHSGKPSCSTAGNEWAFDMTAPGSRQTFLLLLSAQAQGLPISVVGTGLCSLSGDRETPAGVWISPPLS